MILVFNIYKSNRQINSVYIHRIYIHSDILELFTLT